MEEEEKPAFYIRIYTLITFSYHLLLLYTLSFDCREAFVARQAARGPLLVCAREVDPALYYVTIDSVCLRPQIFD